MAAKTGSVNINIVADATRAVRGFKDASNAGEALEKSLKKSTDKMEAQLAEAGKMADLLAEKLGPNFRTTVGDTADDIARQWAKAGLTFQDVERNIDGITGELRRLEAQADDTSRAANRIGDATDRSADATRSFAGNAVGDFAAATTGIGPLGEAVSQLTERLAEGQVSAKGLVTAAAGFGAIAAGMWAISQNAQVAGKNMDAMAKAIKISVGLTDRELLKTYQTLRLLEEKGWRGVTDVTRTFVRENTAAARALLDLGLAGGLTVDQIAELRTELALYEIETNRANERTERFGDTVGSLPTSIAAVADGVDDVNSELSSQQSYLDKVNKGWDRYWKLQNEWDLSVQLYDALFDSNTELSRQVDLVAQYVQEVLGLPPDIMDRLTPMLTDGDVQRVWNLVAALKALRSIPMAPGVRRSITAGAPQPDGGYALGTMSAQPGLRLVGERGPELVDFGGGERVWPSGTGPSMGGVTNITINMPSGSSGDDVVRALTRWVRENGQLPVTTTTTMVR